MDDMIDLLNVVACMLLCLAALWAVLSPRVRDGIVIKLGLGLLALGFFGVGVTLAGDLQAWVLGRALGLVHLGLLIVAGGLAWRWRHGGGIYHVDDWMSPRPMIEAEDSARGAP